MTIRGGGAIIVEPGTFDLQNLGDVAMLQVAVRRLRAIAPDAELRVLTREPDALEEHCPGTLPLSSDARKEWFAERFFLGSVHSMLPNGASRRLVHAQQGMRRRYPRFMHSAMRLRARLDRSSWRSTQAFLGVLEGASMVVIAGQHTLADAFYTRARLVLQMLEAALHRGIPAVMMGQGIGPLTNRELLAMARDVLPSLGLIAVRESLVGPPVLRALGVSNDRVIVTGDDAVEPALVASAHASRQALGVSLRLTPVAGADLDVIERLRIPLGAFARAHGVPIVPLPSAYHSVAADDRTLRLLLNDRLGDIEGEWGAATVPALIDKVGSCRVVVAGAYHVAVFALAQGIPVVALARSHYYKAKYAGLEETFGAGCVTVALDDLMLEQHLRAAMESAWERADELRPRLLEIAEGQVRSGEMAYARAAALLAPRQSRMVSS